MHYIDLVNFFKNTKNPGILAGIVILIENSETSTYSGIKKTLKLSKPQIDKSLGFLEDSNYIAKQNEFYIIKSIDLKETEDQIVVQPKTLPISFEVENVIHHLNEVSGKQFRTTENNFKSINKFLKLGFDINSFLLVNQYYSVHWNNPSMIANINPGTLYNNKFPERLQVAENYFGLVSSNREDVYQFISFFEKIFKQYIDESITYRMTSEDISSLLFWLNGGYSLDVICGTVEFIVKQWSSDIQFRQHLIPRVLFNNKWPSRVIAFQSQPKDQMIISCPNLASIIPSLKIPPDPLTIKSYNDFHITSDKLLYSNAVSALPKVDDNFSYRLSPFSIFLDLYKELAIKTLNVFLDQLVSESKRNKEFESDLTEDFVSWFGGWDRIATTESYLWKNSVKAFVNKL